VSPVEARSPEPPDAERNTKEQEHDFEHGDHVEPRPLRVLYGTPGSTTTSML
jgi:hypothetical protein